MMASRSMVIRLIAKMDEMIASQVNAVIHNTAFQKLEASWRGLYFLVDSMPKASESRMRMRILCLSTHELEQDCLRATDFDTSLLFHKIYSEEYDKAGGQPFGLLLFDFFFCLNQSADWVSIAYFISQIAAAAFAPALIAASPRFLGLDDFSELEADVDIKRTFSQMQYQRWSRLREKDDTRFLNIVLPRTLMRCPYQNIETISGHDDYLWGNPSYVLARSIAMSFCDTGWFVDMRKFSVSYPEKTVSFDSLQQFSYSNLEASILENMESQLSAQGVIVLMELPFSDEITVRSAQSVQQPKQYVSEAINNNALISTMLTYLLCASRFAHYIKVIIRDKLGRFDTPNDCERFLQNWIFNYCGKADTNNPLQAAKYPLSTAKISVAMQIQTPGQYFCKMEIKPNFHIEKISSKLKFVSRIGHL